MSVQFIRQHTSFGKSQSPPSGVAIPAKTSQALWKRSKLAKKQEGSGLKITDDLIASKMSEMDRCHGCQRPTPMIAIGLKNLIEFYDTNTVRVKPITEPLLFIT